VQQGSGKRAASAISPTGTLIGLAEKEPPRRAAQVWEETPKEGSNTGTQCSMLRCTNTRG
jgi:hypothetical protein